MTDRDLDRQAIAEALEAERIHRGVPKAVLAVRAGVSAKTVDRIAKAEPQVTREMLAAVSGVLWEGHPDALLRVGQGREPVDEPPDVANRLDRVEELLGQVVALLEQRIIPGVESLQRDAAEARLVRGRNLSLLVEEDSAG